MKDTYKVIKLEKPTMQQSYNILDLYTRYFPNSNWKIKDIVHLFKKRDVYHVLIDSNGIIVGFVNGKIITTKTDKLISKYISAKSVLIISDIASAVKGGGTKLITQLNEYKLDIFLTSIDIPTMEFYKKVGFVEVNNNDKKDHRLFMVKYINETEALMRRKKQILIIKGNPKYSINNQITKKFYNEISNIIKEIYLIEPIMLESGIKYGDYCETLSYGDLVIGFSRGGVYGGIWKKYCDNKAYFIGIGCLDYTENDYLISNPEDKTASGDMSELSLRKHWELTPEMKHELKTKIKEYHSLTNI